MRPGKRTARRWWGTPAHPGRRRRCRIDGRSDCAPAGCGAPSLPDNGICPCRSDRPSRRPFRWRPHRRRRWAWIARVALQWRCSCFCLESGLCSCKNVDSVRFSVWFGFISLHFIFILNYLCVFFLFKDYF